MLLAAPAFAADVDGKWAGSVETPMGTVPVGFTFKADGATLTGTSLGPDGGEIAIKDGKVDGNKISFIVELDFGGMPLVLSYSRRRLARRDHSSPATSWACRSSSPVSKTSARPARGPVQYRRPEASQVRAR